METVLFILVSTVAGSLFKHYLEPIVLRKTAHIIPQFNKFKEQLTSPRVEEPERFELMDLKRTTYGYTAIYVSSPTRSDTTYLR